MVVVERMIWMYCTVVDNGVVVLVMHVQVRVGSGKRSPGTAIIQPAGFPRGASAREPGSVGMRAGRPGVRERVQRGVAVAGLRCCCCCLSSGGRSYASTGSFPALAPPPLCSPTAHPYSVLSPYFRYIRLRSSSLRVSEKHLLESCPLIRPFASRFPHGDGVVQAAGPSRALEPFRRARMPPNCDPSHAAMLWQTGSSAPGEDAPRIGSPLRCGCRGREEEFKTG